MLRHHSKLWLIWIKVVMTWFQSSDKTLPLWSCDHTTAILPKTRSYFVHLTTPAKIQVEHMNLRLSWYVSIMDSLHYDCMSRTYCTCTILVNYSCSLLANHLYWCTDEFLWKWIFPCRIKVQYQLWLVQTRLKLLDKLSSSIFLFRTRMLHSTRLTLS